MKWGCENDGNNGALSKTVQIENPSEGSGKTKEHSYRIIL